MSALDKNAVLSRVHFPSVFNALLGDAIICRAGENWSARAPWRRDTNPSLSLNITTGIFNDFGDESKRGDIIDLVRTLRGCDFRQALEILATLSGVQNTDHPARPATIAEPTRPVEDFRFIERGCGLKMRKSWTLTECTDPQKVDCFGMPGLHDVHAGIFWHCEEFAQYKAAHDGSGAGYGGPVLARGLPFDVDGHGNMADAQLSCIALVERLCTQFSVNIDDIGIWFSGGSGLHVVLRSVAVSGIPPTFDTPKLVEKLARELAGDNPAIDYARYQRLSLLRVANSINDKSGLYKIPILAGELYCMPLLEMQKRAQRQRSADDCRVEFFATKFGGL